MRLLLFFVGCTLISQLVSAQPDINLRERFYRASFNSESADSFYSQMKNVAVNASPLLKGYKGMAAFMLCNFSYNPYSKLKYFIEGRELLDEAITLNSENTELRFLRYTIQKNIPAFLGYNSNLTEDKNLISKNISDLEFKNADYDLFNRISEYFSSENN